ncbi:MULTISPECIES: thiamine diphosphokinase [unclassified Rhizobium]|uniref:thiamine diphosphokinase n=1 Tax=unclassified Rhizobium TaxID=2613769 RepID=UPI0006FE6E9F|nr:MULTISPECIES: thiamine diphosphokinase [unclassified Rhizobium]KQV35626.1 thiamine pyrophosphokinase [Rhizobium sp. Root1212]KRD25732.1 thiamine pyrophosphokinase [Rhizobium sp. Root268]
MTEPAFTILMGGPLTATARLLERLQGTRIIAADGGMRHAAGLGLEPELWVGDFDSTPAELIDAWPQVRREPYPPAKNETDGEIAMEAALSRGARSLILAGALGGERSDHAFMHLLYAVRLGETGLNVHLTSGEEEATPLLPGVLELDLPKGSLFSILGLDALSGLSIEGARYPLADFHLPFGSSRTISNVAEGPVRFTLASGRAIVLARPYDLTGA